MVGQDLVIIPRKEYDALLGHSYEIPEVEPTQKEKRNIAKVMSAYKNGNFITLDKFKNELGIGGSKGN